MQKHLPRPQRVQPFHPATPENPFPRPLTLNYQAFRLAMEGTTLKALCDLADQRSGDVGRLLGMLRSGHYRDWVWKLDEKNGALKVHDLMHWGL